MEDTTATTPEAAQSNASTRRGILSRAAGILAAGLLGVSQATPKPASASSSHQRKRRRRRRKQTVTLCLDGQTLAVKKKQQGAYLRDGATTGPCTCLPPTQDLQAAIAAAADGARLELCSGTWEIVALPDNFGAALPISKDVTLAGAGIDRTILNGNSANRAGFHVAHGASLRLESLTIQNFSPAQKLEGSGIKNEGYLSLTNVKISGNNAGWQRAGGGILNTGVMSLQDCLITRNGAHRGGGIANLGTATLTSCRITANTVGRFFTIAIGGGIMNSGTITLNDSTVAENTASSGPGGGIWNSGTATLERTQVTRNATDGTDDQGRRFQGGGIFNATPGSVELKSGSSVTDNRPTNCAGSESPVAGCID